MNIELPKDAEGREIPLDTEVLYTCDGSKYKVAKWEFYPNKDTSWLVCLDANTEVFRVPGYMYLTPSDSWEKLEEDLDRCIEADCVSLDVSLVLEDIKQRIRKLRGED